MYIVMLGLPGSGKGTIASKIAADLNLLHISTGDIFRQYIDEGSELGKELESYIKNGLLVPDELTIKIIKDRLMKEDAENGAVLDGYPRTKEQAVTLDKFLENINRKVDCALYLNVDEKVIIERIVNRRLCSNQNCKEIYNLQYKKPSVEGLCDKCGSSLIQRKDDNEEIFKQRAKVFYETAPSILEYYENTGVLFTINNNENSIDVTSKVMLELKDKLLLGESKIGNN